MPACIAIPARIISGRVIVTLGHREAALELTLIAVVNDDSHPRQYAVTRDDNIQISMSSTAFYVPNASQGEQGDVLRRGNVERE